MPTYPIRKTRRARLILTKLLLSASLIAASAGLLAVGHHSGKMMPKAEAGEAPSTLMKIQASPQSQSWSEEWYEIQKAITDSATEEIPTF